MTTAQMLAAWLGAHGLFLAVLVGRNLFRGVAGV